LDEAQGNIKRLASERISIVPEKYFHYKADFGDALVATVPATEMARIHRKYGDKLFERNVRLFLGARKGSINAGIADTLKSEKKSNFWAYNNGLTIVCSRFEAVSDSVVVDIFCIVNGCQSTQSIANNEDALSPSITVLVRFLAVADDLADDVITYTNSQNPIRSWDIASQFKTQRRLKRDFYSLNKPWDYVTRRGDRPLGDPEKFKNGKRARQIKMVEVGQLLAALRGSPVLAYKNKGLIPTHHHDTVFPPDIKVEEVLFAWVCGQIVRDVVDERFDSANDDEKKILIKGASLFTLAVLGQIATLRNGSYYMKQMNEDRITSNHGTERLRSYARYALEAYLGSVQDVRDSMNPEQVQELSTQIRSPEFFSKVARHVERDYRKDALRGDEWLKKALPKLI
jgi:hypothetical protein